MSVGYLYGAAIGFFMLIGLGGCATIPGNVSSRDQSAAEVYVNLGQAYLQRNNLREAKTALERALSLNPHNSTAHLLYAILQERIEQPQMADQSYRHAVRLAPDEGEIRNAYGAFLCRQQRFSEADQIFEKAYRNPFYEAPERALTNAGVCAQEAGDQTRAEQLFRRALERNARYAPALFEMAELSLLQGNYLATRAYLQRFTAVAPHTPETLWMCYEAERALNHHAGSTHCAMRLKNDFPTASQTVRLLEIERVE